jgi:cytochrome c oxidase cbb3-type subunit 1
MVFGTAAFVVAGLLKIAGAVLDPSHMLAFTWFARANRELNFYGFFVMVMFGVVYRVLPQLTGTELPWPKLARLHFWLAAAGVILTAGPWAIGGIVEASQLQDAAVPFAKISSSMLMSLRISTLGDLLLAVGHVLFSANLIRLVHLFYKAKAEAAYAAVTADLFKAAEAKP